MEKENFKEFIKMFSPNPIAVYPVYIKLTGSYSAAVLLAQCIYWEIQMGKEFYKTNESWQEDLYFTESTLLTAKKKIAKYVNIEKKGIPAKNYYSINWENLQKDLIEINQTSPLVPHKTSPLVPQETSPHTISENTQRNKNFDKSKFHSSSEGIPLNVNKLLNKNFSYRELDNDGIPIKKKEKVGGGQKDKTLISLQNEFIGLCKRHLGVTPIASIKNLNSLKFALNSGGLTPDDILDLFDEWFTLPNKTDEQLIQLTQALSVSQINAYKVRNNK